MRRTFRSLALVLVALSALALAACGGSSSGDVKDTLDKAFSTPIKSARIDLQVTVKLDGIKQLSDPVKLSVTGPYESGGNATIPKADWDIAASAAGQNFSGGFISTGDNAWLNFQGQNYEIGKQSVAQINQQIQQAGGKDKKKGLSQFGIDARNWLSDAKDEGTEKVAGVETNHVSAVLDVGKFLDDVNQLVQKAGGSTGAAAQLTPEQKKQIQDVVKNPRFDVYVGKDDNIIRRLSADVSFTVPENQRAQVNGLESGSVSFSIEFADVGTPQTIKAPANAKPVSELSSQLLGLIGGAAGAAGSGGSSGSPSADALQKYSQCLQKADPSKPEELQKCADLVK